MNVEPNSIFNLFMIYIFIIQTLLKKKSSLLIKNVCINKTRIGFIEILKKMGGKIKILNKRKYFGEEIANLFIDAGIVTLASFVSPYSKDREDVRNKVGPKNYIEIFVNTSLEKCEERDSKGLYKLARQGKIKGFTGISDPYEEPKSPDIVINSDGSKSPEELVDYIYQILRR